MQRVYGRAEFRELGREILVKDAGNPMISYALTAVERRNGLPLCRGRRMCWRAHDRCCFEAGAVLKRDVVCTVAVMRLAEECRKGSGC